MKWPRYERYKPSEVEWLSEVPAHWEVKRLRHALAPGPSRREYFALEEDTEVSFVPMDAVGEQGELQLHASKPLNEAGAGYTLFANGDVVVAKITPCFENGKGALAAGLRNGLAFGTTELHVLRAQTSLLDQHFLYYVTASQTFRKLGEAAMYGAGGQKRVPEEFIKDFRIALPSVDEQRGITSFLNCETARLDALIEKRQRMIELLEEKRAALITHTVTRGLNPDVPLKDSGVEWLGRVPAHWEVMQLKRAIRFQRGHDLPADERSEGGVPVISSSGASGIHDQALAKAPGIATGRYGTIGKFTHVTVDYWPLNTVLYSIETGMNNVRFLWWMLHTLESLFILNSQKAAVPGVDRNDLHPVAIALPPRLEQDLIAEWLDAQAAQTSGTGDKIGASIASVAEYRSSLITAAVTGQIDVRARRAAELAAPMSAAA